MLCLSCVGNIILTKLRHSCDFPARLLKKEAADFFETLVFIYHSSLRHNPENFTLPIFVIFHVAVLCRLRV